MKKKRKISILAIVLAILLLLCLIVSLFVNIIFSGNDTPGVFGHYIYMMESDTMEAGAASATADATVATFTTEEEAQNSAASINQYTAVWVKKITDSDLPAKDNAILCVLADGDTSIDTDSQHIAVRRILSVEQDATGTLLYYPTTLQPETIGTEPAITRDNILGFCTYQSEELYTIINFLRSAAGIAIFLALPAVVLVIMLIFVIARASSHRGEEYVYDEDYDSEDYDDSYDDTYNNNNNYDNTAYYRTPPRNTGSSFEQKRSSIADNFERKAVNPDSPYQKARTMQFKAQSDVPIYSNPEDQVPFGASGQQQAQPQERNRDYHPTTPEPPAHFDTQPETQPQKSQPEKPPYVPESSQAPVSYRGSHEAASPDDVRGLNSRYTPNSSRSSSRPSGTRNERPTSNSNTSRTNSRTRRYDDASVDDLLAMIEEEKKKKNKE